ncbi:MAG: AAA family ATPase [Acidimicrobiia bacterium]
MGALLVITGPPGAGKSTVARLVAARFEPSVLVEGDAFFAFLDQGAVPPWLPESHAQNTVVTEAAGAAAGRFADVYTTVYDGIVGPWFLDTFLAASGLAEVHYVVLLPAVETCLARVAARTGHGFRDQAAARKMHHEFTSFEVAARHVCVDDSGSPEATAAEVLMRYELGSLLYEA